MAFLLAFSVVCSQLLHAQRYVRNYFCELLGSIFLSACLVWGFVASLAIIGNTYMVNLKFPLPSLHRESYCVLGYKDSKVLW